MNHYPLRWKLLGAAVVAASAWCVAAATAPQHSRRRNRKQPTRWRHADRRRRRANAPGRPDLLALSNDRETTEAARVIAEVLWDDLDFEREFYMIPRDTYKSIPPASSIDAVPYDRWRELGADGVVIGTVRRRRPAFASISLV
jgi:hypothetical protein